MTDKPKIGAWVRWISPKNDPDALFRFPTIEAMAQHASPSEGKMAYVRSVEAWYIYTDYCAFNPDGINVVTKIVKTDDEKIVDHLVASMVWVNGRAILAWPEEGLQLVAVRTGHFGNLSGAVIELVDDDWRVHITSSVRTDDISKIDQAIAIDILKMYRSRGHEPSFPEPLPDLKALQDLEPSRPGDVVMVLGQGRFIFDSHSALLLGEGVVSVLQGRRPGRWIRFEEP